MNRISMRIADAVTSFAGSMTFVYVHLFWFTPWLVTGGFGHDPFPFGLLTLVVSLEAIFLATFVMISQNRQSERTDARAELDLQVNTKAEQEVEDIQHDLEEIKQLLRSK